MAIYAMSKNPVDDYLPHPIYNTEQNDGKEPIKIPGTGLTLYQGGVEKTPTGKSNAFSESGLTPEEIIAFSQKHGLPTTSNKDFQEAAINMLSSTPIGKQHLQEMEKVFGKTKAGTFADDLLGARTKYLLQGLDKVDYLQNKPLLESSITNMNPKKGFVNSANYAFDFGKDKKAYDEYMANKIPSYASMLAQQDSASKGLSPKGAKLLNAMQVKQRLVDDTEAQKEYFNKYGEFPIKNALDTIPNKQERLKAFLKYRYGKTE